MGEANLQLHGGLPKGPRPDDRKLANQDAPCLGMAHSDWLASGHLASDLQRRVDKGASNGYAYFGLCAVLCEKVVFGIMPRRRLIWG